MPAEPARLHAIADEVGPGAEPGESSVASIDSRNSIASIGSQGSIASIGSIGSVGSIGSIGSAVSIGSIGSIAAIGSIGSIASIGSIGSIASIGSVGTIGTRGSGLRRARGPRGLLAAWSSMTLTTAVLVLLQGAARRALLPAPGIDC